MENFFHEKTKKRIPTIQVLVLSDIYFSKIQDKFPQKQYATEITRTQAKFLSSQGFKNRTRDENRR